MITDVEKLLDILFGTRDMFSFFFRVQEYNSTITFDQFNAYFLNKSTNFFQKLFHVVMESLKISETFFNLFKKFMDFFLYRVYF